MKISLLGLRLKTKNGVFGSGGSGYRGVPWCFVLM
jgi:hypothetical protein